MKRILFVDDEPNVLQGLQRMLRGQRSEWQMVFAASGAEALALLEREPFDVVVSDMRMPGMDGAQLLGEVMRRHPQTVRIVLSGQADREMILRSVGPTHQYLAKPCDAQTLKDAIARACALRELLRSEDLKKLVAQLTSLPSLPHLYLQIVAELQSPDASVQRVGQIIGRDIGMTAKVLHLVNSAFFGLRRHVPDTVQAVSLLGLEVMRALVLSIHLFSSFERARLGDLNLSAVWENSLGTGVLAKRITSSQQADQKHVDHAFLAGLLHDCGKLALAANLTGRYCEVLRASRERRVPLWQVEREALGACHSRIGAYLLGLWGLPDPIVEAVAFHHTPTECLGQVFAPLTAVHVADVLWHEVAGSGSAAVTQLREDYLTELGLAQRVEDWRKLAQELAQEAGQI